MGVIALEGMVFYGHHGYYPEERSTGNRYSVDMEIDVDFSEAAEDDVLSGTVNYEEVYAIVAEVMQQETHLLEHLANKMARQVKIRFPNTQQIRVSVSKYNPPIKGICERARVTVSL